VPESTSTPDQEAARTQLSWQPLGYYNFFRLIVSAVFYAMANTGVLLKPLGSYDSQLFTITANSYLFVGIVAFWLLWRRRPTFLTQATTLLFLDIVFIIVFMHASGGTESGLGILLVIIIAASGLLLPRQLTLLVTALATLGLLAEQSRWWFIGLVEPADFTRAGLLGLALFAAATISAELARRARSSANLAAVRGTELKRLAQLNEEIIQRMQAGVIAITPEGIIQLANRAARELTGKTLTPGESLQVNAPELANQHYQWKLDQQQPAANIDEKIRTTLGTLGDKESPATLIFLDDAATIAQQAQLMKMASIGTLTASIAHEIRNPLTAITTAGELLRETSANNSQSSKLTEIIARHGSRLNRIVEEILQMGRSQPFQPQTILLADWLARFIDDYQLTHELPTAAIQINAETNLLIEFDPDQLHQVLWNLCDNAIQHTDSKQATPWLNLKARYDPVTARATISVIDHGPGVAADLIEDLFVPFFTTRTDGTGLGLYVASELCTTNRATLSYVDQPELGARFDITFNESQTALNL